MYLYVSYDIENKQFKEIGVYIWLEVCFLWSRYWVFLNNIYLNFMLQEVNLYKDVLPITEVYMVY
jgi:hypothetical protein